MIKLFVWLLACHTLIASVACTDAATGNWNSAGSWTCVGTGGHTYPQDGDTAIISNGNTITITANIGTSGGGGLAYPGIVMNSNNANTLQTDGLGAYTIYLASTGTTCGTNVSGITINAGTFSTTNNTSASAMTTIESPSATYPVFIQQNQLVGGQTGTVNLQYTYIPNLGTGGLFSNCEGIAFSGGGGNKLYTNHVEFGGDGAIVASPADMVSGYPQLNNCTWYGRTSYGILSDLTNQGGNAWTMTNCTDYRPATSDTFADQLYSVFNNLTATGVAGLDATGGASNFFGATSTNYGPYVIDYAVKEYDSSQSSNSNATAFVTAPGANGGTIQHSIVYNAYGAYFGQVGNAGVAINKNWFVSNNGTGVGQGQVDVTNAGNYSMESNIIGFDSVGGGNTGAGVFCYNNAAMQLINRTTVFYPSTFASGGGGAFDIGDGGSLPCFNSGNLQIQNSVVYMGGTGVQDEAANTYTNAGTGGVGVNNNDVYGATQAYSTLNTSTNFCTVVAMVCNPVHPSTTYGDTTINPVFVNSLRRIATFDAWLGGPGTDLHFFQEMAARDGLTQVTGNAGGLTYDPRYTPQLLYQYLTMGEAPTTIAIAMTASDGSYNGAMQPVLIGAWIP